SVRRWGCRPPGGGSSDHYYRQEHCREGLVPPFTEFRMRLAHHPGGGHDVCPLLGCPHGNPRHGQRGTTLWVRRERGETGATRQPEQEAAPARLPAYEAAVALWLERLPPATRSGLLQALAADPSVNPERRDDPLVIAGRVLDGGQQAVAAADVAGL